MDMDLWVSLQFAEARMNRWLDGSTPGRKYGNTSFVQVTGRLKAYPRLWSVVHTTTAAGRRATYYLSAEFVPSNSKCYCLSGRLWAHGYGETAFAVHFTEAENAPRKLNRELRRIRRELGLCP